ncbi:hypothetical protein [Patulibacter sp. SYSU D01012]|uniref:hypothetical protein n=1 Tax=Patulibacter sp. SYSU D01012 TaxID=2817381 RepID=UPI001B3097C1|nr:hypothetical protein [Patulibacter sp. SYSU D01012]
MPLRPTTAGALAAAGLASLALAAPASAATEHYGVEVDATVHTSYTGSAAETGFRHESDLAVDTRLTTGFLAIVSRGPDGRIEGVQGAEQHHADTTGTGHLAEDQQSSFSSDQWYHYGAFCTGAGPAQNDEGRTSLAPDLLAPLNTNARMVLNLADQLDVSLMCVATKPDGMGSGLPSQIRLRSDAEGSDPAASPLAVAFELPQDALKRPVAVAFSGPERPDYCPEALRERSVRTTCSVRFEGIVRFTPDPALNGGAGGNGDANGGGGGQAPGGPAVPPPPPASTDDDLLAPLVPAGQRARLDAKKGTLTFRAACRNGCTGTATIQAPARKGGPRAAGAKTAAKGKRLAVVSFAVAKGATARTVTVKLPAKGRKAVRRATGATVALALKDRGTKRTTRATLKVAR